MAPVKKRKKALLAAFQTLMTVAIGFFLMAGSRTVCVDLLTAHESSQSMAASEPAEGDHNRLTSKEESHLHLVTFTDDFRPNQSDSSTEHRFIASAAAAYLLLPPVESVHISSQLAMQGQSSAPNFATSLRFAIVLQV